MADSDAPVIDPVQEDDGGALPLLVRRKRLIWLVALIAGVTMVTAAWQLTDPPIDAPTAGEALDASEPRAAAGERAPNFRVPLRGGGDFELATHLATDGRPVLLNLWASWCIPCRQEMPLLDASAARYPGVHFLGVAVNDTRSASEGFADEIGVTYSLGFDADGAVAREYPTPGMPVTYLISAEGTIVRRFFGQMSPEVVGELVDALG